MTSNGTGTVSNKLQDIVDMIRHVLTSWHPEIKKIFLIQRGTSTRLLVMVLVPPGIGVINSDQVLFCKLFFLFQEELVVNGSDEIGCIWWEISTAAVGNISDVFLEAILNGKIFSLYQGLGTKSLQSVISQFVYFYGYSYFRKIYSEKRGSQSVGTKANLVLAAAAGACTAVITQPLDTASSRMQTSVFGKSKGLWQILSGGTFSDAFDGLGISLLLTSNPAIQYTVFDQLKQRHLKRLAAPSMGDSVSTLSASAAFLLGAVSKCVATVLTYPAIRCKVMIQSCGVEEEGVEERDRGSRKTISGVARAIRKQEGWLGFFKGLEAQMAKTVLSSALLLMIKEKAGAATWVFILAVRRYMLLLRSRV